jgi:hypothetical protein
MTLELSMTIAVAAALLIRQVFTALMSVFFVLIAEDSKNGKRTERDPRPAGSPPGDRRAQG